MPIDRLFIVRHVAYVEDTQELTPEGVVQAEETAEKLVELITVPPREIKLVTTPWKRALLTAMVVARKFGINQIRTTPDDPIPHRDLYPMLASSWPHTEKYQPWNVTIFVGHQGDIEYFPECAAKKLGVTFPRYPRAPYGSIIMIDLRAKTCEMLK